VVAGGPAPRLWKPPFGVAGANLPLAHVGVAAAADGPLADQRLAAGDLPAVAEHLQPAGIGVFDGVVIEDVAIILADAHLAAAHAEGRNGRRAHDPIADVEIVNMLLDNVVAAKPVEEIPIANLILELGEPGMRDRLFDRPAIPVAAEHAQ